MLKKDITNLLILERGLYNNTRKEWKILDNLIKATKKLPYKQLFVRLTDNGFINKGDLSEYIIAYNYFGLSAYNLDFKEYDLLLNNKRYEFKSVAVNPSTELKNDIDILVVLEVNKMGLHYYEIPFNENRSLKGLKITSKLLQNLQQYKRV